MENKKLLRWPRLALGVITLLFAGIIYAWSILKAPFMSEFGWTPSQLGLNYTLTICFFCIGGFFSGLISKKTSPRTRIFISAVLLFAGFFITSRLSGGSVVPLYLAYGVVAGIGIGFVYNTVIGMTNAWFPDKKGLCSGILLMGFGLSSLIIGKIADIMLQSETIGWRMTYLILAIAIGVILVIAAFLVVPPPAGTVFPKPKASNKKTKVSGEIKDYSALEMIKRPSFIKIFIFITLLSAVGSAAISFAKDIVLDVGATASFAVTMVGILSVFNGLGRLVSGWLFDNIGMRKTQYITSAVAIAAPLVVVLALTTDSLAAGVVGVCLCGFSYGFAPTMSSVFSAAYYGQKNFSLNFSIMNLILIPAPFAATLAGKIKDSSGSFTTAFIILVFCSVVGLAVNLSIKKA